MLDWGRDDAGQGLTAYALLISAIAMATLGAMIFAPLGLRLTAGG